MALWDFIFIVKLRLLVDNITSKIAKLKISS